MWDVDIIYFMRITALETKYIAMFIMYEKLVNYKNISHVERLFCLVFCVVFICYGGNAHKINCEGKDKVPQS